MTALAVIESNNTDLRIALEASPNELPAYPVWQWREPNSYKDFGPSYKKVTRQPISSNRQRKKGSIVGLDVSGGFQEDLTYRNTQNFMEGLMFARYRKNGGTFGYQAAFSKAFTANATTDLISFASTNGLFTGDGPFRLTTTTTLPAGLALATDYWLIVDPASLTSAKLASSKANAIAGTAIDITTAGTGTHTMTRQGAILSGTTFSVSNPVNIGAGTLMKGSGFVEDENNVLIAVTSIAGAVVTASGAALVAEAVPPANARMAVVGFQFTAGDLEVDANGDIITTTKDLTTIVQAGEWFFLGGDSDANSFFLNSPKYVKAGVVTANKIEVDDTEDGDPLVVDDGTDTGAGGANLSIRIYCASRLIRNEQQALIHDFSYQMERTLGWPDDSNTAQIQSQYLVGCYMDEWVLTYNTEDKVTWEMTASPTRHETRTAVVGVKAGGRPDVDTDSLFNTSSNVRMLRLRFYDGSDSPFVYLSETSLTVKNNMKVNKAISVLGGFSQTKGIFEVSATATAYFTNVNALRAIENNDDVSWTQLLVKENTGMFLDMPLVGLGDGLPAVALNEPITLPLSIDAVTAATYGLDYTLMIGYFDYLPDVAMATA